MIDLKRDGDANERRCEADILSNPWRLAGDDRREQPDNDRVCIRMRIARLTGKRAIDANNPSTAKTEVAPAAVAPSRCRRESQSCWPAASANTKISKQ